MKFVELTKRNYNRTTHEYEVGSKCMMDFQSGWEIHDNGNEPAHWVNMQLGMNHDFQDTYAELRAKFVAAGLLLDLENMPTEKPHYTRADLHKAIMNLGAIPHSYVKKILDTIMPIIEGK